MRTILSFGVPIIEDISLDSTDIDLEYKELKLSKNPRKLQ